MQKYMVLITLSNHAENIRTKRDVQRRIVQSKTGHSDLEMDIDSDDGYGSSREVRVLVQKSNGFTRLCVVEVHEGCYGALVKQGAVENFHTSCTQFTDFFHWHFRDTCETIMESTQTVTVDVELGRVQNYVTSCNAYKARKPMYEQWWKKRGPISINLATYPIGTPYTELFESIKVASLYGTRHLVRYRDGYGGYAVIRFSTIKSQPMEAVITMNAGFENLFDGYTKNHRITTRKRIKWLCLEGRYKYVYEEFENG